MTAGKRPFAGPNETPGLRQNLEMIRDAYEQDLCYPGEGALTSTMDRVQAAFYQGKVAMLFDAGSDAGKFETEPPFEVGATKFPLVSEDSKNGVNVITNALFIPVNAKHPEAGVEWMRFYTSPEGQAITLATGRPPSTKVMQDKVEARLVKEVFRTTEGDNTVGYIHLQNLSSEINTYPSAIWSVPSAAATSLKPPAKTF